MGKAETNNAKQSANRGGGFKVVALMTLFGCLVPFCLPTLIVGVGFVPTLVALFTDTDPRRPSVATIGYMNLAGVLPFLIELWQKGQSMEAAIGIIGQPFTWAVMLGAAGVGHLILYAVPQAVASYTFNKQEARLRALREGLKQLEAVWGDDVATATSIDIVRQRLSGE